MRFRIDIRRKDGLADPEGVTTQRALADLGYESVTSVHFGRTIYLELEEDDAGNARDRVVAACRQLLANPVIEDFEVELVE